MIKTKSIMEQKLVPRRPWFQDYLHSFWETLLSKTWHRPFNINPHSTFYGVLGLNWQLPRKFSEPASWKCALLDILLKGTTQDQNMNKRPTTKIQNTRLEPVIAPNLTDRYFSA